MVASLHPGWSLRSLQSCRRRSQTLLQAVLDGEDPLGDLQPTGIKLPTQIAAVFEELGDFFFAAGGTFIDSAHRVR
jgi:hypothetical protein